MIWIRAIDVLNRDSLGRLHVRQMAFRLLLKGRGAWIHRSRLVSAREAIQAQGDVCGKNHLRCALQLAW